MLSERMAIAVFHTGAQPRHNLAFSWGAGADVVGDALGSMLFS